MDRFPILVIIVLLNLNINSIFGEKFCPQHCKCDLYKNFNRANCSGLNLINPSINVPENVEIFDLSENSITTLDNENFKGLSNILNLTLRHNSIHTIYLDAFHDLILLQFLDLSLNRLEYFDDRIFENNFNLIELDLSGNKFMSLQSKPLFVSKTLEILHLNNSQITHIYAKLFEFLPALRKLDLSDNLMITLTTAPFIELRRLKSVNLANNRWICDRNIEMVLKFLHGRNIKVQLNACKFEIGKSMGDGNNGSKMFERMVLASSSELLFNPEEEEFGVSTTTARTSVDKIWKNLDMKLLNEEQCKASDLKHICKEYQNCVMRLIYGEEKEVVRNFSSKAKPMPPRRFTHLMDDAEFVFFVGASVGAFVVFFITVCAICTSMSCKKCKKVVSEWEKGQSNLNDFEEAERLMANNQISTELPPRIPIRRRRGLRRQAPVPPRQVEVPQFNRSLSTPVQRSPTVSVQSDFATFISRLFERPERRQNRYYRTLNQNTAQFIRRLSRSNLFNNRLSQHFVNELRNNNNSSAANRNESTYRPSNETEIVVIENPSAPDHSEIRNNENQSNNNNPSDTEFIQRPETPPPAYKDVVPLN